MKRVIRSFAQGTQCLSVGTLTLGLGFGTLVPPPTTTPAAPAETPASIPATAPLQMEPLPAPVTPVQAQAPAPQTPPAQPAPPSDTPAPAPAAPVPAAPPAPPRPSLLHLLDSHNIPAGPFGDLIYQVAARYSLNPHLLAAIVRVESSFNPRALSRKGACGLMQLLPETARRFGLRRKDLFDPAKNLEAGARYLKWLSRRFGEDPIRVLAAYNAGEGAVQRYGGVPPYKETRNYVNRIFSLLGLSREPEPPPVAVQQDAALAR
jgi:soluble lytic murein transglycosylase-like protein